MKHSVQVTILGQQYTVRSEASPREVHAVAAFVNAQIAEIAAARGTADSHNAAVLALMNVAGAYLRLRDQEAASDGRLEQHLRGLLARLEQACPDADEASPVPPGADGERGAPS